MTLLLRALTHDACGRPFLYGVAGQDVCDCVTVEAIAARRAPEVDEAKALLDLVRKLWQIEHDGQPLRIEGGGISTPCACCAFETWNDWTDLSGAYEAAGIEDA